MWDSVDFCWLSCSKQVWTKANGLGFVWKVKYGVFWLTSQAASNKTLYLFLFYSTDLQLLWADPLISFWTALSRPLNQLLPPNIHPSICPPHQRQSQLPNNLQPNFLTTVQNPAKIRIFYFHFKNYILIKSYLLLL
jgi:hypothetical protein